MTMERDVMHLEKWLAKNTENQIKMDVE
jgi:hypothetical protein